MHPQGYVTERVQRRHVQRLHSLLRAQVQAHPLRLQIMMFICGRKSSLNANKFSEVFCCPKLTYTTVTLLGFFLGNTHHSLWKSNENMSVINCKTIFWKATPLLYKSEENLKNKKRKTNFIIQKLAFSFTGVILRCHVFLYSVKWVMMLKWS